MSVIMYPNVGALHEIGLIRTDLAMCKVKLFQNPVSLSPSTVVGDLTEATFGGYAPIIVTALLPAYIDPVGGASAQIATIQFQCDGTAPTNIVYGFWVETAAGVLILAGTFDAGIPMSLATDAIPVDVKFNFGN
jgi:hypothetical protein